MKLKLFLSIMAVSLLTVSASQEALDAQGSPGKGADGGPTASVVARHSQGSSPLIKRLSRLFLLRKADF